MRTAIDLFSGAAGGWTLGLHRAGVVTVAACESDAWRRQAYQRRWSVPVYDDVRTLTAARLRADGIAAPWLLCGSPPCQDASEANHKGRGVEGDQTGLFREPIRLAAELRPVWIALENVRRLRDRGADRVLSTLAEAGYAAWPLVVGLGAAGAAHRRERVWIIGRDAVAAVAQQERQHAQPVYEQMGRLVGALDPDPAGEQGRPAGQSRVDAHADGFGGRPTATEGDWTQARERCSRDHEDRDGQEGIVAWLARVFRGPAGSEPLGRHLRAYDGLSPGVAERCRAAYGDSVSPIIPEIIARALIAWEEGAAAASRLEEHAA